MLLIVAYQMIGCLLQLLTRNLAVGLSLTGIIVSPAFGYAGVGFPGARHGVVSARLGRDPAAALVYPDPVRPGRARGAAALHGGAVRVSSAALPSSLWSWCGCASARWPARGFAAPEEAGAAGPPAGPASRGAFVAEWRRVARRSRRLSACSFSPRCSTRCSIRSPTLASLFATFPIAVVDQDNTELSRGADPGARARTATSRSLCAPRALPRRRTPSSRAAPLASSAFRPTRSRTFSRA